MTVKTNGRFREVDYQPMDWSKPLEDYACVKYEGMFLFLQDFLKCDDIQGWDAVLPVTVHYGYVLKFDSNMDRVKVGYYY